MNVFSTVLLAVLSSLSVLSVPQASATGLGAAAQVVSSQGDASALRHERFRVRSSDGTELSVEAAGDPSAPEILFIHGLRQSGLSWEKQFDDPTLQGFRRVRFDLRGHGDSDKPVEAAAYADPRLWADDIHAVIEGSGLRNPVIVGWSLGGYAAGAYLHTYPDAKVAGLNLVSPVIAFSPDLLTSEALAFNATVTSTDLAVRTAATDAFLAACFAIAPTSEEFDRMLVINGMTPRAVTEGLARLTLTDLYATLAGFPGRILLTHGAKDRLVRVAMSERVREVHPQSELQIFEHSGHSAFFEEPERYNRSLAAFVTALFR